MKDKLLSEFLNPPEEFSPMPFWFWNDDLSEKEIKRQMTAFRLKGISRFIIHPRMGLPESIGYLSDKWFYFVKFAVEEAKKLGMKIVIYDEAMYPSGSCHGKVVKTNPHYASCGLFMYDTENRKTETAVAKAVINGKEYFFFEENTEGTIRGIHYGEDDGEPRAPLSADLLNYDAVSCFIKLTHQRYYDHLADEFGKTIIGFFTDEPMICGRFSKGGIPWTHGFIKTLKQNGICESDLYYLFFEKDSNKGRKINRIYNTLILKRLGDTYYAQLSRWCKAHNVALIGHPEKSTDIAMLSYFDIPCQDIVWRYIAPDNGSAVSGSHSTMAKCASDSARHSKKLRNGNECFGACGHPDNPYAFTEDDMKWYLDWLFVRGCNLIIPHAFFYSVRDARRDERPPDVGMNSMFWDNYSNLSTYIKRCSAINSGGVNITDIAILCTEDYLPWKAARTLYESQLEFNYLEYRLLPECKFELGLCTISDQKYHILISDGLYDESAKAFIEKFKSAGGILFDYSSYKSDTAFINDIRTNSSTSLFVDPIKDLRITHIKKYDKDILFCTNEGEGDILTVIHENIAEIWDAQTGTVVQHNGDSLRLFLPRRKSIHLILK